MSAMSALGFKQIIYVFNGDADGIIATHQLKLAHRIKHNTKHYAKNIAVDSPAPAPIFLTGVKRDINLLQRLLTEYPAIDYAQAEIYVCDISLDVNAVALYALLEKGASVHYFDHHRATQYVAHPRLHTHIDTSVSTCSALIVDAYLQHQFHAWALAAAFGDGLQVAETPAFNAEQLAQLARIGRSINYNAYGDCVADLHFSPETVLNSIASFASPFAYIESTNVISRLESAAKADLALLLTVNATKLSETCLLWTLPDSPASRRANGSFANQVAAAQPKNAHLILTPIAVSVAAADAKSQEQFFSASIRAPRVALHASASSAASMGSAAGADHVAAQFATGGGRKASAGINLLPQSEVEALCRCMCATFG